MPRSKSVLSSNYATDSLLAECVQLGGPRSRTPSPQPIHSHLHYANRSFPKDEDRLWLPILSCFRHTGVTSLSPGASAGVSSGDASPLVFTWARKNWRSEFYCCEHCDIRLNTDFSTDQKCMHYKKKLCDWYMCLYNFSKWICNIFPSLNYQGNLSETVKTRSCTPLCPSTQF